MTKRYWIRTWNPKTHEWGTREIGFWEYWWRRFRNWWMS